MKVTFLGTAAGQPSLDRNTTAIVVEIDNSEFILVDCGEATFHQFMRSPLKISKLNSIFITHMHGDHVFGLPGLMCTLSGNRTEPLTIHGPRGIKDFCKIFDKSIHSFKLTVYEYGDNYNDICLINIGNFSVHVESCRIRHTTDCFAYSFTQRKIKSKINISKLNPVLSEYKTEIEELGYSPVKTLIGKFCSIKDLSIEFKNKVNGEKVIVKATDYIINEPDFKLVVALDNYNCENIFTYFKKCNVLIHESTYSILSNETAEQIKETTRKAISYGHSTSLMAAKNAQKMDAETLILTHFSNRYDIKDGKMVDEESIITACRDDGFDGNIFAAYDFSVFNF